MNLEAVAAASLLEARVLLSSRASEGVLPQILQAEGLAWKVAPIG
jgi:hypothetical protein